MFWAVSARDGAVTTVVESPLGEPYASISLEGGVLHMDAHVTAVSRHTAITAARNAWRDLAANIDQGDAS